MSADEGAGTGMLVSYREREPLACSLVGSMGIGGNSGFGSGSGAGSGSGSGSVTMREDGAMSSSSSGASRGDLLACVGGTSAGAIDRTSGGGTCEPSVTCSVLRQ